MKAWPVLGIVLIQCFLFFTHWFLYFTWVSFWPPMTSGALLGLRLGLLILSLAFVGTALPGFFFHNPPLRLLYAAASVWMGLLNFLFWGACLAWLADGALLLVGLNPPRQALAAALLAIAVATTLYGLANARWIRVRQLRVELDGLPAQWHGRRALLLSDLHLGHINSTGFSRQIVRMAQKLNPDIVFLPGDLFDGGKTDYDAVTEPFRALRPPQGIYFSAGNHDEFGDMDACLHAISAAGIHVLHNEMVQVDGLRVIGVPYGDSTYPIRLRSFLESLHLKGGPAAILLNHVPNRLPIIEQAGVSLVLSGHTHGGQIFPFTWITRRAFGAFTYGLARFGDLQVLTSSGCGTWGPPMRVGTEPELVVVELAGATLI